MTIKTGDLAPNFKSKAASGKTDLYTWIGNNWAVISPQSAVYPSAIKDIESERIKKQIKLVTIVQKNNDKSITLFSVDGHKIISEFYNSDHALYTAETVYIVSPEKYIQLIIPYPLTVKPDMEDIVAAIEFLKQVKTSKNS